MEEEATRKVIDGTVVAYGAQPSPGTTAGFPSTLSATCVGWNILSLSLRGDGRIVGIYLGVL